MRPVAPILRAVLLASATGSALHAACPSPGDLATGIVVRTEDGNIEIHRETRPEWVQIQVTFADGDGSVLELYHGLYLYAVIPMQDGILQPGERETYATLETVRQWVEPRPSRSWTNGAPDGGEAVAGEARSVRIGACSLDGFDVTITLTGEPAYKETYTVLPDLGIALLVRTEDGAQVDDYSYTSMEALQ